MSRFPALHLIRSLVSSRALTFVIVSVAAVLSVSTPSIAQAPIMPAFRRIQAPLVSPADAAVYYAALPGQTSPAEGARSPRLRSLARALGREEAQDIDRIYEFVRNGIEFEPVFGLTKGGEGAWLDRSGGAFDQTQLFIDLAREAGFTARYVRGRVDLPGAVAASVLRVQDAAQACALLAGSGTPAVVNNQTSCAGMSGDLTAVRMMHVWAEVLINGQWYVFDPSLKEHTAIQGVDLWSAMGTNPTSAWSFTGASLGAGGSSLANYDRDATYNALRTYSQNLQTRLRGDLRDRSLEQLAGGWRINLTTTPRQTTHPYAAAWVHDARWAGDVPDAFRARVTISAPGFSQPFDLPTLYPHRVQLQMEGHLSSGVISRPNYPNVPSPDAFAFAVRLRRCEGLPDNVVEACRNNNTFTGAQRTQQQTRDWDRNVTLAIDHPFAASGGAYGDETMVKAIEVGRRVELVVRSGGGSGERYAHHRQAADSFLTPSFIPGVRTDQPVTCPMQGDQPCEFPPANAPPGEPIPDMNYFVEKGGIFGFGENAQAEQQSHKDHVANLWAAAVERTVRLVEPMANARIVQLHHLGVALSVSNSSETLDVESSVAIAPAGGGSATPVLTTLAAASSAAEGAAVYQLANERLSNGLNVPAASVDPFASSGVERLSENAAATTILRAGQTAASLPSGVRAATRDEVQGYLNAGFEVAVTNSAEGGFLARPVGGGQAAWVVAQGGANHGPDGFIYAPGVTGVDHGRMAFRKGAGPDALAYLGADQARAASENVAPTQLGAVSLRDGSLTFAEDPDLTVGQGDFPYSLSFQRTYSSGGAASNGGGMGPGWTHNWTSSIGHSTDLLAVLGEGHPVDSAPTLAALRVGLEAGAHDNIEGAFIAGAVMNWWSEQSQVNTVQVAVGADQGRFTRQIDGSWHNAAAPAERLVIEAGAEPYRYIYTRTLSDGSQQKFNHLLFRATDNDDPGGEPQIGASSVLALSSWTWPSGMRVHLDYEAQNLENLYSLRRVRNDVGVEITLTQNEAPDSSYCTSEVIEPECVRLRTFAGTLSSVAGGGATASFVYSPDCETGTNFCYAYLTERRQALRRTRGYGYGRVNATRSGFNAGERSHVLLSGVGDDGIQRAAFEWDAAGEQLRPNVIASFDAQNRQTDYYTTHGILSAARDAAGGGYRQTYDDDGRLTSSTDPVGRTATTGYHPAGWVSSVRSAWGDLTTFGYDERGNLTRRTQASRPEAAGDYWWGQTVEVLAEYHPTFNKPTRIILPAVDDDPVQRDYQISYTGGEVTQVQAPETWDHVTGSRARGTWTTLRDDEGRPVLETDPMGVATAHAYAERGNPTFCRTSSTASAQTGGFNFRSESDCDTAGNEVRTLDPRGNITTSEYDSLRRRTYLRGPVTGMAQHWQYDLTGDLVGESRLHAETGTWRGVTSTFSPTGRVLTATDVEGDVTRTCYDGLDRPSIVVDGEGRATRTLYNAAGDPLVVERWWRANTSDATCALTPDLPAGQTTHQWRGMAYNSGGLLAQEADANFNVTEHQYDGLGRRIVTTHPAASAGQAYNDRVEYFLRNQRGEVMWHRRRSPLGSDDQIRTWFDEAGRERHRWELTGAAANYQGRNVRSFYDRAGRSVYRDVSQQGGGAWDDGAVRSRIYHSYDDAGRLRVESAQADAQASGPWQAVTYGYDASSNRTSITWPDDWAVTYGFDAANRMASASWAGGSVTQAYDSLSQPTQRDRANGNSTGMAFQPDGDLYYLNHYGIGDIGLGYNAAGQINYRGSTYPAFDWSPPAAYGGQYGTANGQNQVASAQGLPLTFDPSGAMTSDGVTSYDYDVADRMVTANRNGMSASYSYDAQDRRVGRTVNGYLARTLWAGEEELAEYDTASNLQRRFIPGAGVDQKLAVVSASGVTRYLYADHQGSIVASAEPGDVNRQVSRYSPYGEHENALPPAGTPFGYTGRAYDYETGLYYYRARYYSPRLGQFTTADPIGGEDDPNLYFYVSADPLNMTDSDGMQSCGRRTGSRTCERLTSYIVGGDEDRVFTEQRFQDGQVYRRGSLDRGRAVEAPIGPGELVSGAWAGSAVRIGGQVTQRVFWSGSRAAAVAAEAHAAGTGGVVLQNTLLGRSISGAESLATRLVGPERARRAVQPAWAWASRRYASGARGPVDVFIRRPAAENSLWRRYEEPILRGRNPIREHAVTSGG